MQIKINDQMDMDNPLWRPLTGEAEIVGRSRKMFTAISSTMLYYPYAVRRRGHAYDLTPMAPGATFAKYIWNYVYIHRW